MIEQKRKEMKVKIKELMKKNVNFESMDPYVVNLLLREEKQNLIEKQGKNVFISKIEEINSDEELVEY